MSKVILYKDAAREKLLAGASMLAEAVRVTLGPSGRTVLIKRKGESKNSATKDGVTVAHEVASEDYIEQQAIEAIQSVAANTDEDGGDGTTTATILAQAILKFGSDAQEESKVPLNFVDLKRGIDVATHFVVEKLKEISRPIETKSKKATEKELMKVALISSNNDIEISKIVVDAHKVSGREGVVHIKRSVNHKKTYMTNIDGVNLPTGYRSIYFINDLENQLVRLNKPYIYMTDESINSVSDNLENLLTICSMNQLELLILCKDMDPAVLGMLATERQKGTLKVCVCHAPGFGEEQKNTLKDLGIIMGQMPFIDKEGMSFNDLEFETEEKVIQGKKQIIPSIKNMDKFFPRSEEIMCTDNRLSIKGPIGLSKDKFESIKIAKENQAEKLSLSLKKMTDSYEKGQVQTRISRLREGMAYLNIGAISDIEYEEKQDRIKDALYAVKSAASEGIIPGGGTTLYYISGMEKPKAKSHSVRVGIDIVFDAIQVPFFQILDNVGILKEISDETKNHIRNNLNTGFNARTGEISKDMIADGIIDPVKVTRVALENAASVAGTLLTTDCVIVDTEAYEPKKSLDGLY